MQFNFRNVSPLAWMLGVSALANVITMAAVLYLAVSGVYVRDGYVDVTGSVRVKDGDTLRVQVVRMP